MFLAWGRVGGRVWAAEWLVVAGWVDYKFADELAGGGVDDADVQVLDDHQDGGPGVLVAGADVVEAAVDALSLPPFSGHLT